MLKTFFTRPRKVTKRDITNIDVTQRHLIIKYTKYDATYTLNLPCTNGYIRLTSHSARELIDFAERTYSTLAPKVKEPLEFKVFAMDFPAK